MSEVLFENECLKLIESMNEYIIVSDNMRVVFNSECKIDRVCIEKCKKEVM
ncbi:MAG: hypothetical protein J6Y78_04495 [Paludibacteraceae bacterium]|nr:hypothetical protein [Paludibacteraceae bacterium]